MSFLSNLRVQDYRLSVEENARQLGWTVEEYEETLESLIGKGYEVSTGMQINGDLYVVLNDPRLIETQEGSALLSPSSCPHHDRN